MHITNSPPKLLPLTTQPPRRKRKPRPEPLVIPAQSSFGYASRLRSPRLWSTDPTTPSSHHQPPPHQYHDQHNNSNHHQQQQLQQQQRLSPPAYTPPPMLSPIRSGAGLFWSMPNYPLTPMTAPVRRMSLSSR